MPHLEFHTYAGQLFWLAVTFVTLYVVLSRLVLPRISEVIENRGQAIATDLAKAEAAQNEAQTIEQKYEKLLADTGEKARKLIDESSQKAKVIVDKKRAELSEKLDEKLAKAEKEISKIEKESLQAVEEVSKELSKAIVSQLTGKKAA